MRWSRNFKTFFCVLFLQLAFLQLVICSSGSVPRELNHGAFANDASCGYHMLPLHPECLPRDLGSPTTLDDLAHSSPLTLASRCGTSVFFTICFYSRPSGIPLHSNLCMIAPFLDHLGHYCDDYFFFLTKLLAVKWDVCSENHTKSAHTRLYGKCPYKYDTCHRTSRGTSSSGMCPFPLIPVLFPPSMDGCMGLTFIVITVFNFCLVLSPLQICILRHDSSCLLL